MPAADATQSAPSASHRPTLLVHLRSTPDKLIEAETVHGILEQAQHYGWQVLNLEFTQGLIPADPPPLGAILHALPDDPMSEEIRARGIPVVRIGTFPHPLDHQVPAVLHDIPMAGRIAVEHFVERGFRHVGYLGRKPWSDTKPLYQAFRDHANQLGCECHLLRIKQTPHTDPKRRYAARRETVKRGLAPLPKPLGLLCSEDWTAGRLCTWCQAAGLRIPEEVAVLGRNNVRFACESSPVPLSSIDMNREAYGRRAVHLLHDLIHGTPAPDRPVLVPPKEVVARRSTDILAIAHPVVARALRYIWDHLAEQVSVDTVAEHVGVSRRPLERAFRKHLGRGVNEERVRKRLEQCCHLLVSTDMPVHETAAAVGFPTRSHFYQIFRKTYRVSPAEFRQRMRKE